MTVHPAADGAGIGRVRSPGFGALASASAGRRAVFWSFGHSRQGSHGCGWVGGADIVEPEPQRHAAGRQVAVDRAGNGHGRRGVGVPPGSRGQFGESGALACVAAGPGVQADNLVIAADLASCAG